MSRIYFFATGPDISPVLSRLEEEFDLEYVEENRIPGPTPQKWTRVDNLPSLGYATGDQEICCASYLIMKRDTEIHVVSKVMFDGETRFDVYPSNNPDSLLLRLGGFWRDGSLISGHLISSSEREFPRKLINSLRKHIKNEFTKVGACWVGPEALLRLRNGMRLCAAIQSPPEYDLREP